MFPLQGHGGMYNPRVASTDLLRSCLSTDLTQLHMSVQELMQVIDGRTVVQAHGSSEMPVWGTVFEQIHLDGEHAKRIASNSARGNQSSLSDGRRAHCATAPFGIDKLIMSSDGRPAHRLRNKANGEQWRMHSETGEVLEVFPPNQPGQSSSH